MKRSPSSQRSKKLRLSVSLDQADYQALHKLATSQRPPLSDSYIAAFAIKRFLEAVSGNQMVIDFLGRSG